MKYVINKRDYKSFAPGEFYHIYNRGNNRQEIFLDGSDYSFFLLRLNEYLHPEHYRRAPSETFVERYKRREIPQGSFSLVSYCLMPNHFHLLLRQNGDLSLSTLMLQLGTTYSRYFNKRYGRVGSLFQDQFKAIHVDSDQYLLYLSAYIHQNPRAARMVPNAETYTHSSYKEYLADKTGICDTGIILDRYPSKNAYRTFVEESLKSDVLRDEAPHLLID